jgi:hypothetical protein
MSITLPMLIKRERTIIYHKQNSSNNKTNPSALLNHLMQQLLWKQLQRTERGLRRRGSLLKRKCEHNWNVLLYLLQYLFNHTMSLI